MALFFNQDKFNKEDSVYGRRAARGEIPAAPAFGAGKERIEELQNTIRELTDENSKLRDEIARMQEQIDGLQVTLSIEQVIQGMSEKPQADVFNPFAAFASLRGGTGSFASTSDGESSDDGTRIISDEEMKQIDDFLDGTDIDSEGLE